MADCKIVNDKMVAAVDNIGGNTQGVHTGIAKSYKEAGEKLMEELNAAIATMEGETKDAMQKFFNDTIEPFVTTDLPDAINGMAVLLEANRTNFIDVDKQIAQSISGE